MSFLWVLLDVHDDGIDVRHDVDNSSNTCDVKEDGVERERRIERARRNPDCWAPDSIIAMNRYHDEKALCQKFGVKTFPSLSFIQYVGSLLLTQTLTLTLTASRYFKGDRFLIRPVEWW